MSNLARRPGSGSESTRVLLVRQPIRSVRSAHDDSPLPIQLAIGVIVSVGVIMALWLMGHVGFYLGFAPLIGVPGLEQNAGGAIIAAIAALLSMPMTILRAGMNEPLWLMLGFVVVAIPAACLGAVRPSAPGGPKPHILTVTFAYSGAIMGSIFSLLVLWWLASPMRFAWLQPMPSIPIAMAQWLAGLRLAAALDLFCLIAMSLWVVLVMRLAVPGWLRGLSAGLCFTILAFTFAAVAVSGVSVNQVTSTRTVAVMLEGATSEQVLLLGEAHDRLVSLRAGPHHVAIDLIEPPGRLRVVNRRSIADYVNDYRADD